MHSYEVQALLLQKGPSEFARRCFIEISKSCDPFIDRAAARSEIEAMKADGRYVKIAQEVIDA